jgi:hypothetical protein
MGNYRASIFSVAGMQLALFVCIAFNNRGLIDHDERKFSPRLG